jgi:hypothetical protein
MKSTKIVRNSGNRFRIYFMYEKAVEAEKT